MFNTASLHSLQFNFMLQSPHSPRTFTVVLMVGLLLYVCSNVLKSLSAPRCCKKLSSTTLATMLNTSWTQHSHQHWPAYLTCSGATVDRLPECLALLSPQLWSLSHLAVGSYPCSAALLTAAPVLQQALLNKNTPAYCNQSRPCSNMLTKVE